MRTVAQTHAITSILLEISPQPRVSATANPQECQEHDPVSVRKVITPNANPYHRSRNTPWSPTPNVGKSNEMRRDDIINRYPARGPMRCTIHSPTASTR